MTIKNYLFTVIMVAFLIPTESTSRPIIIAVLDTGIDKSVTNLCKFGHKSFVDSSPLSDNMPHGTHIAGLINQFIGSSKHKNEYCIVSIKWWQRSAVTEENVKNMTRAIQYAININVDYINISAGGNTSDPIEKAVVTKALDKGITIIAAAGNNGADLSDNCNFYPACYDDRIVTVGNWQDQSKSRQPTSNYGNYIKQWEIGTNLLSNFPNGKRGYLTGTSQATAVATGKLVKAELEK